MHCLSCHYSLRELDSDRCPECGRVFDPADPRTFSRRPRRLWPAPIHAAIVFLGIWVAFAFLSFMHELRPFEDISALRQIGDAAFDMFFLTCIIMIFLTIGFAWGRWKSS